MQSRGHSSFTGEGAERQRSEWEPPQVRLEVGSSGLSSCPEGRSTSLTLLLRAQLCRLRLAADALPPLLSHRTAKPRLFHPPAVASLSVSAACGWFPLADIDSLPAHVDGWGPTLARRQTQAMGQACPFWVFLWYNFLLIMDHTFLLFCMPGAF